MTDDDPICDWCGADATKAGSWLTTTVQGGRLAGCGKADCDEKLRPVMNLMLAAAAAFAQLRRDRPQRPVSFLVDENVPPGVAAIVAIPTPCQPDLTIEGALRS